MNVFISYRRDDTQDLAGRLADRIRAVPQVQRVFIDVEEIEPGADFASKIHEALAGSSVCILVIGPRWRGAGEGGRARILEDGDFVRREAAAALAGENKILPLLANGAAMPQPGELPPDLQRLPAINALSIRHAYFDHDIELLIDALLSRKKRGAVSAYLKQHPALALVLRLAAALALAIVALIGVAAVHGAVTGRSLDQTLGGPGQVWLLIIGVMAIAMGLAARRR